jgi:hypothetical protein
MPIRELCGRIFSATMIATGILTGVTSSMAVAQDAASMSCGELWHARNVSYKSIRYGEAGRTSWAGDVRPFENANTMLDHFTLLKEEPKPPRPDAAAGGPFASR